MEKEELRLSGSDPEWLDALPRPVLKTLDSIGLDDQFFRTLRDVPKAASRIDLFRAPEYSPPLKFFGTATLTYAVTQVLLGLPSLASEDPVSTILKGHFAVMLSWYAMGMAVSLFWMHVILALNALTRDWVAVPYREGLRRLLFIVGWGTFYFAFITALAVIVGKIAGRDEISMVGMFFGGAVASFQYVLIVRALSAPWRVAILGWTGFVLSLVFAAGVAIVFALAEFGY